MPANPKNRRRIARPNPTTGQVETIDSATPPEEMEAPPGGARPAPDEALDDFNRREWEEEARIESIINDEENEGAKVEIMRKDVNARWCFCDSFPLADWNNDRKKDLSTMFGGGEYKARVRKMGGTYGPSFQFWIDRNLKPQAEARNPGQDMAQTVERLARGEGIMPVIMQMMQMQQSQSALMMQQQRESSANMLTVITTALTRPAPANPMDRLMEILLTKVMAPAPLAPAQDLGKIIEAVGKLKDLASGDEPRGRGDKPDLLDTLISGLPGIMKALATLQQPQGQPQPAASAAIVPAAPRPAPVENPRNVTPKVDERGNRIDERGNRVDDVEMPEATLDERGDRVEHTTLTETGAAPVPDPAGQPEAGLRAALAAFLPTVIELADGGTPANDIADKIVEGMTDESFDGLCELLERPDWMALLADVHDGVMLRSNFFIELRASLLADDETGEESP